MRCKNYLLDFSKTILLLFALGSSLYCFSQPSPEFEQGLEQGSSSTSTTENRDRKIRTFRYRDSIQYYKIISADNDTSYVDLSLSIAAFNKINQRRKDDFGYQPYPNMGEGYTPLVFDSEFSLTPKIGQRSRSMYYYQIDDMQYYDVRTPFSEAMYYSFILANAQGQVLDFSFAVNPKPTFNIAVGYRGMRSSGFYPFSESSQGKAFLTSNYHTKDFKYRIKGHFTYQYLSNTENGGITAEGIGYFTSNDPAFSLRQTFPTNLSTTSRTVANRLSGSRVYIDQTYDLFNSAIEDPKAFRLSILNEIIYENRNWKYIDPAFSSTTNEGALKSIAFYKSELVDNPQKADSSRVHNFDINVGVGINIPYVNVYLDGKLNYNYNSYTFPEYKKAEDIDTLSSSEPTKAINGSTAALLLHGKWSPFKYFGAQADFKLNFLGLWIGSRLIQASAYFQINPENRLIGAYKNASYFADLNSQYYVSNYKNFNWNNDFKRIEHNEIKVDIKSKKIVDAGFSLTNIGNYVYYDNLFIPKQADTKINIISVYLARDLLIKGFGIDTKIMFQKVLSGQQYVFLPEFLGRLSLYYKWLMFDKKLEVMAGFTTNYYTAFRAQIYNPLLSDYTLQDQQNYRNIGNYPFIDAFLNFKVRRTRIYVRYENASSWFGYYNYFSAPNMPFLDATLRFGIVWDWFN